jgi:hypothetical protein
MLSYRDYLCKQLMTKYGLSPLANGYLEQIIKRLKELEKENDNKDATFVLNLLGENTQEVEWS